jgi:hypothetical protein
VRLWNCESSINRCVQEKQTPQHQRKSGSREKNIPEDRAWLARAAHADGTFQKGLVKTFFGNTV